MNKCSVVCRELGSTGSEVKWRMVEQKGCSTKGWRMSVPSYVGALDHRFVVSRSIALQVW